MEVLMVAAELAPYARATAAADAVPSLAKALRQLGHRVTVALPRYRGFEAQGLFVARRLTPLSAAGGEFTVFDGQLASGVEIVLFDVPGLGESEGVYGGDELERFTGLARASAALAAKRREQGKGFEVLHGHDWPGALAAAVVDPADAVPVVTIHDARHAGFFDRSALSALLPGVELGERPSALAAGLARARAVTAVSPTYARSLVESGAPGVPASVFSRLAEPAFGIENGLDYAVCNPTTDSVLEARFDAEDPWGKARTKGAMLRRFRLDLDIERPLIAFVSTALDDGGAELVLEMLPGLLKNDVAVVLAVSGSGPLADGLRAIAEERPEVVAFTGDVDDELRRRLYGGADFVLVPSRVSPEAFPAQLAQRYGALPIAHATGGLIDAVVDADAEVETGTGFLFDRPTGAALLGATERALAAYASEAGFARLRRRAMRLDLGWDRPARRYAQVYRRAIEGT